MRLRIPKIRRGTTPALRGGYLAGTLVFVLLTLAVVNAASWWFLGSVRSQLEEQLARRLLSVATLTAGALDGEGLAEALGEDPERSIYLLEAESLLERFHRAAAEASEGDADEASRGVTNITLLSLDGRVLADAEGRIPAGTPSPLLDLDRSVSTAAAVGIPGTTELYEAKGFLYKSAYAGVSDSEGKVQGLVVVEASADFFDTLRLAQRRLWLTMGASGLAVLALGGLFLWLQRGISRLENGMRRAETLSTMGRMVASLAHEIRNPLAIIGGAAERIKAKHGHEGDEIFDYIPEEVARLNAVLTAYLDFARSPEAERDEVSVPKVAEKALVLMESDLTRRGIAVERDYDAGDRLDARVDATRLQQVFLNLFLNARDAMPQGGRLTLGVRRVHHTVEVLVKDTGEGIARERLDRIFEPFYSGKERGSGLGLAIVEKIVRDHGGRISVDSRVGAGTAFRIELPA
jgi:signal transduction histidine kinase